MVPTLEYYRRRGGRAKDGIQRVVEAMHQHLPSFGWQFVDHPRDAELFSSHAGALSSALHADVAHCHGLYPTYDWLSERVYFVLNARVVEDLRWARAISVPSDWVAEILRRDMHLRPMVIGHGLDLSEWPEPESFKREAIVLWDKNRKGDVCDVAPVVELARLRPEVRFISTFGDPLPNLQVTGLIPFEELKRLKYRAAVYLATTKETFGIATLEAMAAGMPVLGFRWGGTADIVEHKVTGYLAEPGDFDGLAEGLDFVLDNREELGRRAAQVVRERYPWAKVMRRYDALYRRAVEVRDKKWSPKVSVIIPCYNYARHVAEAMQSVLDQDFQDWECIVVNDGSTDDSLTVIRSFAARDPRFMVVDQPNSGVAAARNKGASLASGAYFVFLDADDRIEKEFLSLLVREMDRDRTLGVAYTGLKIGQRRGPWPTVCRESMQFQGRNQVPICCMVRREAFERAGGFRQRMAPAEDAELWLKIFSYGFYGKQVTPRPLFDYRLHEGSASSSVRGRKQKEPDWTEWLPWCRDSSLMPCASTARPSRASHPVRYYDRPLISVILIDGHGEAERIQDSLDSLIAQTVWQWEAILVSKFGLGLGYPSLEAGYPFLKCLSEFLEALQRIEGSAAVFLLSGAQFEVPGGLAEAWFQLNRVSGGLILEAQRGAFGAALRASVIHALIRQVEIGTLSELLGAMQAGGEELRSAGPGIARMAGNSVQLNSKKFEEERIDLSDVKRDLGSIRFDQRSVLVEYIGRQEGYTLWRVPSGAKVKFDRGTNRIQSLKRKDAEFLEGTGRFRIVRR